MRILVASSGTIPGYSGGWTTTLDLLGDRHIPLYVITDARPGVREMEGVRYLGLGLGGSRGGRLPGRLAALMGKALVPMALKTAFRRFGADFVLCLDETMGFHAAAGKLPYAMRFHRKVEPSVIGPPLERLLEGALFSTACQGTDVPGVEVLPHNEDLSRYSFAEAERPRRALLLTCVNEVHEPDLFIEGVCLSRDIRGDIVGTGPSLERVKRVCRSTGGRVRCLEPVPRLRLNSLSGRYQIGVATIIRRDIVVYQMKINMYLACGMHTMVKPYTHIMNEAPEFAHPFSTPEELAERLDQVQENWRELESRRRSARDWVLRNYSVEIPRRRFEELLGDTFEGYRPAKAVEHLHH